MNIGIDETTSYDMKALGGQDLDAVAWDVIDGKMGLERRGISMIRQRRAG